MTIKIQRRVSDPKLSFTDSIHPLLQRVYRQREILSVDDLNLGLSNLLTPDSFKDMDKALDLLVSCLVERKKILIVSDFDADGATSCVLAINVLRQFGANAIEYIVPNRFEFGYGLTPKIVELAKLKNPDLIVTVDNGISSIEGVETANTAGIDVLITDHHIAPSQLPAAQAIINPNQPECDFESKCIAGVGAVSYTHLTLPTKA